MCITNHGNVVPYRHTLYDDTAGTSPPLHDPVSPDTAFIPFGGLNVCLPLSSMFDFSCHDSFASRRDGAMHCETFPSTNQKFIHTLSSPYLGDSYPTIVYPSDS